MARRNDHSRDELRGMVLKAGREIVSAGGVQALTMREVAKRIGYSPGTLYVLFKNADDLKLALNAGTVAEMRHRLRDAIAPIADPEERLMKMAILYLEFGLGSPNLWRLMFEHQLPGDDPMPEVITQETDALLEFITGPLAELVPNIPTPDINKVAASYWAAVHGISHLVITEKLALAHAESAHDVLEFQVHAFISGIRQQYG